MINFIKTIRKHPVPFILVVCSHIVLIILILYCNHTKLFSIFTPTQFTPIQCSAKNMPDSKDKLPDPKDKLPEPPDTAGSLPDTDKSIINASSSRGVLEYLYNNKTRYVHCTVPTLYYTGYDNTNFDKITGHYYYALDDTSCTIYLLSCDIIHDDDSVPLTITDLSFNARLTHNDVNLKSLLRNLSADINWNYYSLSQCTGTIVVDQTMYSTTKAILLLAAIIVIAVLNVVQIVNLKVRVMKR